MPLVNGVATYQIPRLGSGVYLVKATYGGDDLNNGSSSQVRLFWVIFYTLGPLHDGPTRLHSAKCSRVRLFCAHRICPQVLTGVCS